MDPVADLLGRLADEVQSWHDDPGDESECYYCAYGETCETMALVDEARQMRGRYLRAGPVR